MAEDCKEQVVPEYRKKVGEFLDLFTIAKRLQDDVSIAVEYLAERKQNYISRKHGILHNILLTDQLRLSQIYINLLSNAIKYTPDGGTIEVESELQKGTTFRVTLELAYASAEKENFKIQENTSDYHLPASGQVY